MAMGHDEVLDGKNRCCQCGKKLSKKRRKKSHYCKKCAAL
jgi:hypothetical protein